MSKRMGKIFSAVLLWLVFAPCIYCLADWTYTVRRGDTLYSVAHRYGVSFNALRNRNGLYGSGLHIGQRIIIPTGVSTASTSGGWNYTVRRGDTIFTIARRTGVSVGTLRSANGLWSNGLRIGQRVFIPTGGGRTAVAPTRVGGDAYMLARLIFAEAGAEPYVGKVAVGAVVLNRTESPKFPGTIAGVIFQPHAFESVSNGIYYNTPTNDAIKAARDAISGWDPSGGALFFFNPSKTSNPYIWSRRIIARFGKHVFAL